MSICAWCKKELPGMDGSHGICKSCDVDMRRKAKLLRHDDDEPTTESELVRPTGEYTTAKQYRPEDLALSFMGQTITGFSEGSTIVVMHARCLWCGAAVPGDHGVRYVCGDCDSKYMSYADYEEAQERRRTR